jgi:hypothetical protein
MDKSIWSKLISILLIAAIAIAGIFGYNIVTTQQQQIAALQTQVDALFAAPAGSRAVGDTNFTNLVASGDATIGGALAVTGAISGGSFTPATFSSATDIFADTGVYTTSLNALGTLGAGGAITGTAGATISGATTSLNASSNFATNINTGSSSGAVTIGGNSGTVAINSSDWDITTTGAMTGIGALTADGAWFTSSTIGAGGAISATGAINSAAGVTAGTFLVLTKAANVSVVADSTITPLASYQPITAAATCGTASIAPLAAGTVLRLINVGSNTITITDTGTLMLSGDIALGQYDSLLLLSDGTNWVQMGTSNN